MGILFNTPTWRPPLQLIENRLPDPALARTTRAPSQALSLFTTAGWLGQSTRPPSAGRAMSLADGAKATCRARSSRTVEGGVVHADGRFVISGRMSDVCDELDRLAALEQGDRPLS